MAKETVEVVGCPWCDEEPVISLGRLGLSVNIDCENHWCPAQPKTNHTVGSGNTSHSDRLAGAVRGWNRGKSVLGPDRMGKTYKAEVEI